MASGGPAWHVGERTYDASERTLVMGILNVTPDSFSDGGLWTDPEAAADHAAQMVDDGADILDVGGESTRPGSEPVDADEEIRRVVPVVEELVERLPTTPVSVDTRKASVAAAACSAGATIVNDVSAGADPEMFHVASANRAAMVLMHMQGDPKTMQENPTYSDVVREVHDALGERIEAAVTAGVEREAICVDPGIGFGKSLEHNLSLMKHTGALADLGRPILVGPSRKAFIGTLLDVDASQRLEGTAGATAFLVAAGAQVVRVHDVRELTRVVRIVDAIKAAP